MSLMATRPGTYATRFRQASQSWLCKAKIVSSQISFLSGKPRRGPFNIGSALVLEGACLSTGGGPISGPGEAVPQHSRHSIYERGPIGGPCANRPGRKSEDFLGKFLYFVVTHSGWCYAIECWVACLHLSPRLSGVLGRAPHR
jgi:hypothetical protein